MRILQICSARSIGGGERHVADLSNELTKRGHDVFAAVVPGSPMPTEMIEVPASNIAAFPLRNAADIGSAIKIAKFVRRNRVEVINAHLAKDYPVAAGVSRLARVPFVITRHVLFSMSRLHRVLLRDAKFAIAPSNAAAESLLRQQIFPEKKIVTIRYGLDISKFSAVRHVDHEGIRIGGIGNLDPVKGFDVLIRAAAIVATRFKDVRFVIVGEDRSAARHNEKELRELIRDLNLEEMVELAGWSDDVPRQLSRFDLFVSSSRSESFGFAIAEAMLMGLPVIATETEGAKEIIARLSFGQLVPIDSPRELSDAILALCEDPAKREQLARYGRAHVIKNFSLERMVSETERLYGQAITPSR
jgi:glycosyltransferase involved in cell wall biosynthesis